MLTSTLCEVASSNLILDCAAVRTKYFSNFGIKTITTRKMSQNSSGSPPTKRRRPIAKIRKQYPVKVENLKYKVPQSIYEKAKKQIFGEEKNNYEAGVRLKCHQVTYSKFNSLDPPNCRANFFEAAKQAMVSLEKKL